MKKVVIIFTDEETKVKAMQVVSTGAGIPSYAICILPYCLFKYETL